MDDILNAFVEETKPILFDMTRILDEVEENPANGLRLAEFGRLVDGVMGNAKVMAVDYPQDHAIQRIAIMSELCRYIAREVVHMAHDLHFIKITNAFLHDATELLVEFNEGLLTGERSELGLILNEPFLNRLRVISRKFDKNRQQSAPITKESANSTQNDIDAILKQLEAK